MECQATVLRGPRTGGPCRNTATMIVTTTGERVCGVHARGWMNWALARIAYWNEKAKAWL